MGLGRAPLLLAAALVALSAAGPAAADREPRPGLPQASVVPKAFAVPKPSVRPPAAPRKVSVDGSVPGVSVWRLPVPGVSISVRQGKRRPVPKVTVPGMTIYQGSVCGDRVQVGECPRRRPREIPRPVPGRAVPVRVPAPTLTPTPTPTSKVTPPIRAEQAAPPVRRKNPLATVLVMVVLVSAIASTTAVAFGSRR
ncbi:hypothetical protein [Nonomuraea basaltis]|uniref:hypothetical protein n=1 Tax=Nonomuraea basaltis TaxID=2495887 RepID=UPI00110C4599|nr:hypothetical protein [Nonomuraea basaltis]TMR89260.1 hypothetical protein EJK15_61660 [Nonomuraea basaltis]